MGQWLRRISRLIGRLVFYFYFLLLMKEGGEGGGFDCFECELGGMKGKRK